MSNLNNNNNTNEINNINNIKYMNIINNFYILNYININNHINKYNNNYNITIKLHEKETTTKQQLSHLKMIINISHKSIMKTISLSHKHNI